MRSGWWRAGALAVAAAGAQPAFVAGSDYLSSHQTVTIAAAGDEHHLSRGAVARAVATGHAARVCSGAWHLSPRGELHVTLPRPVAHAADAAAGASHAELLERGATFAVSMQGVPRDDSRERFADDFEVVYTDELGAVLHRNSTPPAHHFTLQSADGQWEGLFVLTDHMETDHLYGWLDVDHGAANDADGAQLVLEPVLPTEVSGTCPKGEFEHVVYVPGAVGLSSFVSFHGDAGVPAAAQASAARAHARALLLAASPVEPDSSANIAFGDDMAVAPPGFSSGSQPHSVTHVVPTQPPELSLAGVACTTGKLKWEADLDLKKLLGGGTVGKLIAATSGMSPYYKKAGIKHKASKIKVLSKNYAGTINDGLLKMFNQKSKSGGAKVVAKVLASGNKGPGPVVGRAYVGTACANANMAVVNGASNNLNLLLSHEVGHTYGSLHTTCGDYMGPSGGRKTPCDSTANFFSNKAATLLSKSCMKKCGKKKGKGGKKKGKGN